MTERNGVIITIRNLYKIYQAPTGPLLALRNVSFDIHDGEFVSFVGPSGCGEFEAFPAQTMVATPDSFGKNKAMLANFTRAVAKTTHWCISNYDQCTVIAKKMSPETWVDASLGGAIHKRTTEMTRAADSGNYGEHDRKSFETYLKFLQDSDPNFKPPVVNDYLNTELLAGANKFDKAEVAKLKFNWACDHKS